MGRLGVIACFLVAIAVPGDDPKENGPHEAESPSLSIRIVPTSHDETTGRAIQGPFHVVVTNVSKQPVRLWKEWCSWGYYNLSFIAAERDGKTVAVKKWRRSFFANSPDWMILPPGDHLVFDVSFAAEAVWQDAPLPRANQPRRVLLRAVYEVTEDGMSKKFGVWTGRVASPEAVYTIGEPLPFGVGDPDQPRPKP
jgi:hypothetical protein